MPANPRCCSGGVGSFLVRTSPLRKRTGNPGCETSCVCVRVTSYTHVDIIITSATCWFRAIDLPTAPTLGGGSGASARSALRRVDGLAETAACLYDRLTIVKPGEAENFFLHGTRDSAIDVCRSVVKEAWSCVKQRLTGGANFPRTPTHCTVLMVAVSQIEL